MKENINIALSPNSSSKDALIALKELLLPWKWFSWRRGGNVSKLESQFRGYFDVAHAFAMNSGRESLYAILKSLDLKKGDEVILQSFTCMVVINSIVWNGLKPVYADIDKEDFNMEVKDFEGKITKRAKVVIVQHTFGIPAKMDEIKAICKKRKLILIEDCAHTIGGKYKGEFLGTIGDIGFYSFGRSKVLSCVSGGMIVTNDKKYGDKIKGVLKYAQYPKKSIVARNLFHPIAMECVKKLYNIGFLGKLLLLALQKLKFLTLEIEKNEKLGEFARPYPLKMANALAAIALYQFANLDRFNARRKEIAKKYYKYLRMKPGVKALDPEKYKGAFFLRYPVIVGNSKKRNEILKSAKHAGIVLGDWYLSPIAPPKCATQKTFYADGSCPNTEEICSGVVNLPLYYNLGESHTDKILKCLK